MIELGSVNRFRMCDRISNEKGRICYGTFNKTDEPFLGFSGDNIKSETYYDLFERMRKSYQNPFVVLKRLPGKYFHGGRVSKRIGDGVKSRRTKSTKRSEFPDIKVEVKPVRASARLSGKSMTEIESQLLSFDEFRNCGEDLERCSSTAVCDSVQKVPDECRKVGVQAQRCMKDETQLEVIAEKEGIVQTRHSSKRKIHIESRMKRAAGRHKCIHNPVEESEYQPYSSDNSQESLKARKRMVLSVDTDSGSEVPDDVNVEEGKSVQTRSSSRKREIQFKDKVVTKRLRGHPKYSDQADSEVESQLLNSQKCRRTMKCSFVRDGYSVQKVPGELIAEEKTSIQAPLSIKCQLPLEAIAEKEERVQTRSSTKCENQLEDQVETKRVRGRQKRTDQAAVEVKSQLCTFDSTRKGEKKLERYGKIECNSYAADRDLVQKVPHELMVEENRVLAGIPTKCGIQLEDKVGTKCALGLPKRSERLGAKVKSHVISVDNSQKCEERSESSLRHGQIVPVQRVPDEAIEAAERTDAVHPTKSNIHLESKVETIRPRSPAKHPEHGAMEVESLLRSSDDSQMGEIGSSGSYMDVIDSVQRVPDEGIVAIERSDNAHPAKINIRLEKEVETKHPRSRSTSPVKCTEYLESQLLNDGSPQKPKDGSKRCVCLGKIECDAFCKIVSTSIQRVQNEVFVAKKENHACRTECKIQLEKKFGTIRASSPAKRLDKSAEDFESQLLNNDMFKNSEEGSKGECHGDIECDGPYSDVCYLAQKVQDEVIVEEDTRVQATRCTESEVPPEVVASKEENVEMQHSAEFTSQLDGSIGTKLPQSPAEHTDKSALEVESLLHNDGIYQTSEEGSKRACQEEIGRNGSCCDVSDSVPVVPDELIVEEMFVHCTKCKIHLDNKVETECAPSSLNHCKSGAEVESQLINADSSQNPMVGSKLCSCHGEIGCDVSCTDVSALVPNEVIAEDDNDQPHPTKCKMLIESNVEIKRPGTSALSESQLLPDDYQKSENILEHHAWNGGVGSIGSSTVHTGSVQRKQEIEKGGEKRFQAQPSLIFETQHERNVEMKLGSFHPGKLGVEVKSQFFTFDNSQKCDGSDPVQKVPDDAVVEHVQTQHSMRFKTPLQLNAERERSVQAQCSKKAEVHLDKTQATVFPQLENLQIVSTCKSTTLTESKEDTRVDEAGSKPCSSEEAVVQAPWERMRTLLKPCVVRLERVRDIEKVVRRANDDSAHYPVVVRVGRRKSVDVRTHRGSLPLLQHSSVDVTPNHTLDEQSSAGNMEGLARIDLSDGLALKKFCELKTISLIDSDSDEENVLEERASSPIQSCVVQDLASSPVLSHETEDPVSSPNRSNVESDWPNSTQKLQELDPCADAVVSENPVPSGVQALNELGFLEHEYFQFGKELPSESIWNDVLDFGEADEPGMEKSTNPQSKYCDLFPLPSEDNISCMNSEKAIEMDSILGKINEPEGFDNGALETVNMKSGKKEDLVERVERFCHNILGSDKECVVNDTLMSNEDAENPHLKSAKPSPTESEAESEFPTSLKSPGILPLKVSRKGRNKERNKKFAKKERTNGFHNPVCDIGPTPSDKGSFMNDSLMSNKDVEKARFESSESTPAKSLGESEFLTSLIGPGKIPFSHQPRNKEKAIKHKSNCVSCGTGDYGTAQGGPKEKNRKEKKRASCNEDSCDMDDNRSAQDGSLPVPKSNSFKSLIKKRKNLECGREKVSDSRVETDRASRELKYRLSTNWLTKNFNLEKGCNDGSVGNDIQSEGIKSEGKEEVPTSEKLYRDLSTIPYILKCNLQNRCRKCKNLNPCANANKKFQLFFTLTVGVGRRLSKPLMETLRNQGDECEISRTTAYIAASAAASHPTTVLVPAFPNVVQKILPVYHSNLLMQLVAETEEIAKKERKSMSDMAIAETLQFKRALIAMKARYPTGENQDLPQSKQSTTGSQSLILQSVQPGNPFTYKSNQIIAMKSKVDNKFRFVRKCLVSILPKDANKGVSHPIDDEKKSADFTQKQLTDSHGDKIPDVQSGSPPQKRSKVFLESDKKADVPSASASSSVPANSKGIATLGRTPDDVESQEMTGISCDSVLPSSDCQLNGMIRSSTEKRTGSLISCDENHNESIEPIFMKQLLDSSCRGKIFNDSGSNAPGETVPQILTAFSLSSDGGSGTTSSTTNGLAFGRAAACIDLHGVSSRESGEAQKSGGGLSDGPKNPLVHESMSKPEPCQPLDAVVTGNLNDAQGNRSHHSFSSSCGIFSMENEEPVNSSAKNETKLNQAETAKMTVPLNQLADAHARIQDMDKVNETSPHKEFTDMISSLGVCAEFIPDIEPSENQLPNMHPSARENTPPSLQDPSNSQKASEETPDVILIPDEFESIDLTAAEEETIDLANDPILKWGVICTSLPELGFVKVLKISEKLIIYDKAVVSDPLGFDNIQELNKFLNSRLANLTYSYQSKIALEWILVTSGYLKVKTIPPTNPLFWRTQYTAKKTLTDMRDFAKRYRRPQKTTSTPFIVSCPVRSSPPINFQTTKNGQIIPAPRNKCVALTSKLPPKVNFDKAGKVVRINGQTVVMGTPAAYYSKPQNDVPDLSSSAGLTVASQVSSVSSVKPPAGSKPVSAAVNRLPMVTGTNSVPVTSRPNTVPAGLVYTYSPSGYVPLVNNRASSMQAESPLSTVRNQETSAARFPILPTTISSSSQPSSFLLNSSQPRMVNSVVSSASRGPAPRMYQATTICVSPASSALRNQTPPQAPRLRPTTAIRVPSVSSASRNRTPSLPAPRIGQTSAIRAPFKQVTVSPGSVRYMTLASIAPGSIASSESTTTTVKSSSATSGSTSAPPKQVSGAGGLPPSRVPVAPATQTTTVSCSPKSQAASESTVCASTALSQKLAEALSQKLGPKFNNPTCPPKNRPILILRKSRSGGVGTSNPITFVFQKP